jgi:hypothetical protein
MKEKAPRLAQNLTGGRRSQLWRKPRNRRQFRHFGGLTQPPDRLTSTQLKVSHGKFIYGLLMLCVLVRSQAA